MPSQSVALVSNAVPVPSPVAPVQTTRAVEISTNAQDVASTAVAKEQSIPKESVPATRVESEIISTALTEYFRLFGAFPSGGKVAIAAALAGQNPKKAVLLAFKRVGKQGELLDPWGQPYDIHVTQDGRVQVRSAGPNAVIGDDDDKVIEHQIATGVDSPKP